MQTTRSSIQVEMETPSIKNNLDILKASKENSNIKKFWIVLVELERNLISPIFIQLLYENHALKTEIDALCSLWECQK